MKGCSVDRVSPMGLDVFTKEREREDTIVVHLGNEYACNVYFEAKPWITILNNSFVFWE